MKYILIFFFLFISSLFGFSQTGPAGIGNSTDNVLWLNSDSIDLLNNSPVSNWSDISGNSNNALQANATFQPTYSTAGFSTQPSVTFDGVNDRLELMNNVIAEGASIITVQRINSNNNNVKGLYTFKSHGTFARSTVMNDFYKAAPPFVYYTQNVVVNQGFVKQLHSSPGGNGANFIQQATNSTLLEFSSRSRDVLQNNTRSFIGCNYIESSAQIKNFFLGDIAEVIVFNRRLSRAERRILNSYLAGKYQYSNLAAFYSYYVLNGNEVIGIGQESDGSNLSARGKGNLSISNPSSLGNGDYLIVGNDGAGYSASTSVPTGVEERWTQVWRTAVTNSPGTINMEFFLGTNALTGNTNDYVLLIDDDGDFSNGGTTQHTTGVSYDAINNSISFTNVSLSNGNYFTLGIGNATATSITDGSWKNRSTWDCNCIPDETYNVNVADPFEVIIDSNARALSLNVEDGAILMFGINDTLDIELDLTNAGNIDFDGAGTLMASGNTTQEFVNNGSNPIEVHNLYINNTGSGLNITTGGWTITNNLQVTSGGLDVTGTDSVVLVSDASKTSQILESMSNAFAGSFKIERYVSSRNSDFSNIASPLQYATFADLDDEIFMSGIGGNDGNASDVNKGIFYSTYGYIRATQTYDTITSTADTMVAGVGYEIYLGTNIATYTQGGFSYDGVPNSGDVTPPSIEQGFNLVGNPYHSFIDFDQTDKSNIDDVYYIYSASSGSYVTFSGASKPPIASSQSYWINKSTPGSASYNFEESDKVDSTSSAFVRKKNPREYSILLKNTEDHLHHKFSLKLNSAAVKERDQYDIVHLPSPHKYVPQIYSTPENSATHLSTNALNVFDESQVVPLNISSESNTTLVLETENFDELRQEYSCMYLKDKSENKIIDLNFEEHYSFETNDNENRFEIILSNSYADCEKLIEAENITQEIDYTLSLRNSNGMYYLDYQLPDELQAISISLYNLNGQLVKEQIQFTASGEGFYRLNNLEDLKGMYLIQVKGNDLFLNKTIKL